MNKNNTVLGLLKELKERIDEHDVQLNSIYDAIENLVDKKEELKDNKIVEEERECIGFKKYLYRSSKIVSSTFDLKLLRY